jgi:hypothetical protein
LPELSRLGFAATYKDEPAAVYPQAARRAEELIAGPNGAGQEGVRPTTRLKTNVPARSFVA